MSAAWNTLAQDSDAVSALSRGDNLAGLGGKVFGATLALTTELKIPAQYAGGRIVVLRLETPSNHSEVSCCPLAFS